MRKTVKFLATLILALLTMNSVVCAASLVQMNTIMSFRQAPNEHDSFPSDALGKLVSLNGHKLRLKPVLQVSDTMIMGGSVKLQDANTGEELFSFPLKAAPYFRVKKIAADTGEEFLLIQSGSLGVTDSSCRGIWVVGLHKGKYVSFINIDTVQKVGLLFDDIISDLEDGEIKLTGFARDWACRVYDSTGRNVIGYRYKGHPAYLTSLRNCEINSTYLFWDSKAQWFGIRQAN